MDQKPKLMTPFDMLVTSSSLYTLKLMLPFAPASIQRSLAIYIKFSELKATMEHFLRRKSDSLFMGTADQRHHDRGE